MCHTHGKKTRYKDNFDRKLNQIKNISTHFDEFSHHGQFNIFLHSEPFQIFQFSDRSRIFTLLIVSEFLCFG